MNDMKDPKRKLRNNREFFDKDAVFKQKVEGAKKGKGAYKRKPKYKEEYTDEL